MYVYCACVLLCPRIYIHTRWNCVKVSSFCMSWLHISVQSAAIYVKHFLSRWVVGFLQKPPCFFFVFVFFSFRAFPLSRAISRATHTPCDTGLRCLVFRVRWSWFLLFRSCLFVVVAVVLLLRLFVCRVLRVCLFFVSLCVCGCGCCCVCVCVFVLLLCMCVCLLLLCMCVCVVVVVVYVCICCCSCCVCVCVFMLLLCMCVCVCVVVVYICAVVLVCVCLLLLLLWMCAVVVMCIRMISCLCVCLSVYVRACQSVHDRFLTGTIIPSTHFPKKE